jgi:hypothetical protein
MLFKEILERFQPEVDLALDELFNAVKSNQTHEQDLLLVNINASYQDYLDKPTTHLSPFVYGPGGWIAFADRTQLDFFASYSMMVRDISREEYFQDYSTNITKQGEYEFLLQMELMIYLKFWESEPTLRRLYQLSTLAQGKNYDWYFKLGKRERLIRKKIRDRIQIQCPKYYHLLKDIYLSQIRNAAAHTQFYLIRPNTRLGFTNYKEKVAPLTQIEFYEWGIRFHKLVLLYNGLLERLNNSYLEYIDEQKDKHYGLQIRIPKISLASDMSFIKYVDIGRKDWMWYVIWSKYHNERSHFFIDRFQ